MATSDGHLEIKSSGPGGHSAEIWLDGKRLDWVISVDLHMSAVDVNTVTLTLVPSSISIDLPDGTVQVVRLYDEETAHAGH